MIIINLAGLVLIGLIIWWFWLYQPKEPKTVNKEQLTEGKTKAGNGSESSRR